MKLLRPGALFVLHVAVVMEDHHLFRVNFSLADVYRLLGDQ